MVILVNLIDDFDTATTTTTNKSMGVDLSATQFCFELFPSKPTFVFIADGESGGRKMYGVMG